MRPMARKGSMMMILFWEVAPYEWTNMSSIISEGVQLTAQCKRPSLLTVRENWESTRELYLAFCTLFIKSAVCVSCDRTVTRHMGMVSKMYLNYLRKKKTNQNSNARFWRYGGNSSIPTAWTDTEQNAHKPINYCLERLMQDTEQKYLSPKRYSLHFTLTWSFILIGSLSFISSLWPWWSDGGTLSPITKRGFSSSCSSPSSVRFSSEVILAHSVQHWNPVLVAKLTRVLSVIACCTGRCKHMGSLDLRNLLVFTVPL